LIVAHLPEIYNSLCKKHDVRNCCLWGGVQPHKQRFAAPLFPQPFFGRIIQHISVPGKPGAVAGAIPASFLSVPVKGAAHVGAPGPGKTQQIGHRFQGVYGKLLLQNAAGRGE
jgi:hypothetical protein